MYTALTDIEALAQAKQFYEDGLSGMETEYAQYLEAVTVLEQCSIPREQLIAEKADVYEQLAEINRKIRAERENLAMCQQIQSEVSHMERETKSIENKEVLRDEHRRR